MIALSDIQSMAVRALVHVMATITKVTPFKTGVGMSIQLRDGEDTVWLKCFGEWPSYEKGQLVEIRGQVKPPWQGGKKEIGVDAKNAAHRIEKVEREEKTHLQKVLTTAVGAYVTVECEVMDPDEDGWECDNGNPKKRLVVKQNVVVEKDAPPVSPVTLYLHVLNVGKRSYCGVHTIRVENAKVQENMTSGKIELVVYNPDNITVLSTRQMVLTK